MNFYDLTLRELENYFISEGQNKAKAQILYKSIYRRKISLENIGELSEKTKAQAAKDLSFPLPEVIALNEDGETVKVLLGLSDGSRIETVLMRHQYGSGLCVSTQVGCAMSCAFCQSGRLKKRRSLTAGEMVSQIIFMSKISPVAHVSIMGIGEPLDNFDNVKDFLEIISSPYGLAYGERHITLSTCGIVPMINRLHEINAGFNLAVSLHASSDELRSRLMPINKRWGLKELLGAIKTYSAEYGKRIAFEYILIDGINDSTEQAKQLAELTDGINCFVNLIPYNETAASEFKRSKNSDNFFDALKKEGVNAVFRREFGSGIKAACGQLSAEYE